MKVIFLDIDGVLNSTNTIEKEHQLTGRLIVWFMSPILVDRLNKLIEATGALIVISSTWRIRMEDVYANLRLSGFKYDRYIIGKTPWLGKRRGQEIQAWLDDFGAKVEKFVILDDNSDMDHLHPFHINTSFETGLQDRHVEAAIRMLS